MATESGQKIDVVLGAVVDKASISKAGQDLNAELSRAAKNAGRKSSAGAPEGVSLVRSAQQVYESERTARRSIIEAQQASRRLYDFAGNPFLVVSNLTSSISGIKGIRMGLEAAQDTIRQGTEDARHYREQLARLDDKGISKRTKEYKEMNKGLKEANAEVERGKKLEKEMIGRTKGPGFVARSIFDFGLQQLATGAMFTFAFQGAALIMTKLGEVATKAFTGLVAPAAAAREALAQLSDSLQKAGGADTLKSMGLLSQAMYDMAKAAEAVSRQKDVFVAIAELQRATFAEQFGGLSPAEAMFDTSAGWGPTSFGRGVYGEERQKWRESIEKYVSGSVEDINAAFELLGKTYNLDLSDIQKRFNDIYQSGMGMDLPTGIAGVFAATSPSLTAKGAFNAVVDDLTTRLTDMALGVTQAADAAKQAAINFDSVRSDFMGKMEIGFKLAGLTGKSSDLYAAFGKQGLPYQTGASILAGPGAAAGEFNQFITDYDAANQELLDAQEALSNRQIKASNAGIAAQWAQIRMQRAQIRAGVAKSMVGAVGMTGFELAAQIAEAREQARLARLQLNAQEKQLRTQASIAAASKRVADANTVKSRLEVAAQAAAAARDADKNMFVGATQKAWIGKEGGDPVVDVLARKIVTLIKAE